MVFFAWHDMNFTTPASRDDSKALIHRTYRCREKINWQHLHDWQNFSNYEKSQTIGARPTCKSRRVQTVINRFVDREPWTGLTRGGHLVVNQKMLRCHTHGVVNRETLTRRMRLVVINKKEKNIIDFWRTVVNTSKAFPIRSGLRKRFGKIVFSNETKSIRITVL